MRCSWSRALAAVAVGLLAWTGAPPAWAQPTPTPETGLLQPDGVVDVQGLPPAGPRVPVHREMRFLVPDLQELRDTKARHVTGTQPAPSASAQVVGGTLTSPSPATGFPGLSLAESGGWIPPDTQVGVGPNYVVGVVNLEMRIWDKTGTPIASTDLNTFFQTSAQLSDPKILFDALSDRWFVAAISYNGSFTAGAWRLAVSTTADPFTFVRYTASTSKSAPDFPALGINDDKVVLTANAFRGNSFLGTEFLVINKAQLVGGGTAASTYFGPPRGLFTIQPARSLSSTCSGVPVVCPLYMAAVAYNSATSIRVWSLRGVPGAGGVTVSTTNLAISTLTSPPDAAQPGSGAPLIQTNDNRLLDAAYRGGLLWVSATSACVPALDTATRACLRFIELATAGGISKVQDLDFGLAHFYYYYPAIQIDGAGDLIAGFSGSSTAVYAGVYAGGQPAGGPGTFQDPLLIHSGENTYTPFANRWGDYSGAALDPSNPAVVWVAGEYAKADGGSDWGTWIAPVQMGP